MPVSNGQIHMKTITYEWWIMQQKEIKIIFASKWVKNATNDDKLLAEKKEAIEIQMEAAKKTYSLWYTCMNIKRCQGQTSQPAEQSIRCYRSKLLDARRVTETSLDHAKWTSEWRSFRATQLKAQEARGTLLGFTRDSKKLEADKRN